MTESCFLYVIGPVGLERRDGPVKIGISKSPTGRLAEIQTSCPFEIELFCVLRFPERSIAQQFEKALHAVHHTRALHGEWFDMAPVEAVREAVTFFFECCALMPGECVEDVVTYSGVAGVIKTHFPPAVQ